MKFGVCNEIFQGWEIEAAMKYAAGVGYNGVELAPFTLARTVTEISPAQRQRIRDSAARLRLEICGLHWLLARAEGLHLNHPDSAVRDRTGKYLCDLVDCCADLGGKVLVLGSPRQRNVLAGVTPEQAWELAAATVTDAVQRAEERGVVLCLEPLAPAETNFINSAAQAIRFAQQFNSPAMQIILDVKAMCAEPGQSAKSSASHGRASPIFTPTTATSKDPASERLIFDPLPPPSRKWVTPLTSPSKSSNSKKEPSRSRRGAWNTCAMFLRAARRNGLGKLRIKKAELRSGEKSFRFDCCVVFHVF